MRRMTRAIMWSLVALICLMSRPVAGDPQSSSAVKIDKTSIGVGPSGHIRGLTNTMPLYVEILYNDYQFAAAFAVASLLTILALVTLVAKSIVEWQSERTARRQIASINELQTTTNLAVQTEAKP